MTYSYNAKVSEVLTGDTFIAKIDLGFGKSVEKEMKLMGIEAPAVKEVEVIEKGFSHSGVVSKNKLTELIKGKDVIIETRKTGTDYVARVSIAGMPLPINDYMVRYGLAKMKR